MRFTTAFRGYRMSEVDALLDRLTTELEARSQVVVRPEEASSAAPEPGPAPVPGHEQGESPGRSTA